MVIGGSGGYLEGFWRDQHFCQCSFFRALPTYSDGILHIPVHVLVFREYPRIFPSGRSYPPDIPACDRLVSNWGQTSQPKARTNKQRLYYHDHSVRTKRIVNVHSDLLQYETGKVTSVASNCGPFLTPLLHSWVVQKKSFLSSRLHFLNS